MRKNAARVLLEIMKEMVRTRDSKLRQLKLAHDFRMAVIGRPSSIRSLLRRYHLLEMPEEWNQVSFDGHVHDSNTKGRKSPSASYNGRLDERHPPPYRNILQLCAAEGRRRAFGSRRDNGRLCADRHRGFGQVYGAYIQLIYVPAGFSDARDFISFLADRRTKSFMEQGKESFRVSAQICLAILEEFNRRHRLEINESYGLNLDRLDPAAFLSYVGAGQPSILHLAKFIHEDLLAVKTRPRVED